MEPIDPQTNGPQLLYGLRNHIHINAPEEAITACAKPARRSVEGKQSGPD